MAQPKSNLPVQITLYTTQIELMDAALAVALKDSKDLPDYIANGLWDLQTFFSDVLEHPNAYAPTGQMARSLKVRYRRIKGPREQPKPMGREARRKRRREEAKARRVNRAATAEQFNIERAKAEADLSSGADDVSRSVGIVDRLLKR